MDDITSNLRSVQELIVNNSKQKTLTIPNFQRDYVWGEKQVLQLFQDFSEDSEDFEKDTQELPGYLLGNIVLVSEKGKNLIIDGQQRLTTISLIYKALHNFALNNDSEKIRNLTGDFRKGYAAIDSLQEIQGVKINHENSQIAKRYSKIVLENDYNTKTEFQKVYNVIEKQINNFDEKQFLRFATYLGANVKLIVTITPNMSTAFQLFEVLNDRGVSLEPLDLIKNVFLKTLEKNKSRTVEFENNWTEFKNNLIVNEKNSTITLRSTFLKNFTICEYGQNIIKSNIFNFYQKQVLTSEDINELSRKLKRRSKFFNEIEHRVYSSFENKEEKRYLKIIFEIIKWDQIYPLLMFCYDAPANERQKIIEKGCKYLASKKFSLQNSKALTSEITKIIESAKEEEEKNRYSKILDMLDKEISKNVKKIKEELPIKNFKKVNKNELEDIAGEIIKYIEIESRRAIESTDTVISDATIEHISAVANDELELSYLHRIGNLTLLSTADNSSAGNRPVSQKIETYKKAQHNFNLTKALINTNEPAPKSGVQSLEYQKNKPYLVSYLEGVDSTWGKEEIKKRSQELTDLLISLLTD